MAALTASVRWLRYIAAIMLFALIAASVAHQIVQVAARFLPHTVGIPIAAGEVTLDYKLGATYGRGFSVPAPRICMRRDRYRYVVDGTSNEALRIYIAQTPAWGACESLPHEAVDVHYVPWAVKWAVPKPEISLVHWLYLLFLWVPLLIFLVMPGRVARWSTGFLLRLTRISRRK